MASLYSTGSGPIASIVNYFSAGGTQAPSISASVLSNSKETLYGLPMTGGTLYTFHNITGRGRLNLLHAYTKDATNRTVRAVVIIDGVTVFDATSSAITTSGSGIVPVGIVVAASGALVFQSIDFQTSCVVQIASSLSETDKVATGINYETWS